MAESVTSIWNMALSAAGARGTVSDENTKGREADLCRVWYPQIRDLVLKSASWPCARSYARLAQVAEYSDAALWTPSDPAPSWRFAYAEPSDMLAPRYLTSFARFERARFDNKPCIMANEDQAILHYSALVTDVTRWDTGLAHSVIFGLAAAITLPLSGKRTLSNDNKDKATEAILLAQTEVANESDSHYDALPSWIAARGYSGPPERTKFFWPYESLTGAGF